MWQQESKFIYLQKKKEAITGQEAVRGAACIAP
jgi:hypothetical protein